ncbi:hypothetical protein [Stieleria varia]|uniref:Uncharacterized protein n=1 Tax=Stieleria varia TaxID=2528005 RepID=A0A5C6AZI5_9BACT|nr:hypothetical protein [Stieleria varia]TWU04436.1 hypothetical protein Pla52n_24770 [Stieleria varia]
MNDEQHLNSNGDDESIADALRGLVPATATIDVREVFYRAGYEAALAERSTLTAKPQPRREIGKWRSMLAASLLTALVTLPTAYTVGTSNSSNPVGSPHSAQAAVPESETQVTESVPDAEPALENGPALAKAPTLAKNDDRVADDESSSNATSSMAAPNSPSPNSTAQSPINDFRSPRGSLIRWTSRWQDRKRHGKSLTAYHGSMELMNQSKPVSRPYQTSDAAMANNDVDTSTFTAPLSAGALRTVQDFEQFTFSLENSY